jgi:hypothetical protein
MLSAVMLNVVMLSVVAPIDIVREVQIVEMILYGNLC